MHAREWIGQAGPLASATRDDRATRAWRASPNAHSRGGQLRAEQLADRGEVARDALLLPGQLAEFALSCGLKPAIWFVVSVRSWSACALAWATIWPACLLALETSCWECWSAARKICSVCALAAAARCSASVTRLWVAGCGAAWRSASRLSASSRREASRALQLGFGLGPLRLAFLQDPPGLAAYLVRLPPGGGEKLVPLLLRGGLQLGDLPLSGSTQPGDVLLGRGLRLRHLVAGRGADASDLAFSNRGQLVSLPPGCNLDRVRFPPGGSAQVAGFPYGTRPQLRGLIPGRRPQFGRLRLCRSQQLVGGGPGLTEDLDGMLLGKPQQRLDPEPRTRTGAALPQLALHCGQLMLQRLDLFPVPAGPGPPAARCARPPDGGHSRGAPPRKPARVVPRGRYRPGHQSRDPCGHPPITRTDGRNLT